MDISYFFIQKSATSDVTAFDNNLIPKKKMPMLRNLWHFRLVSRKSVKNECVAKSKTLETLVECDRIWEKKDDAKAKAFHFITQWKIRLPISNRETFFFWLISNCEQVSASLRKKINQRMPINQIKTEKFCWIYYLSWHLLHLQYVYFL